MGGYGPASAKVLRLGRLLTLCRASVQNRPSQGWRQNRLAFLELEQAALGRDSVLTVVSAIRHPLWGETLLLSGVSKQAP